LRSVRLKTYEIYGRRIASGTPLAGIAETAGPADFSFAVGTFPAADGAWFDIWPTVQATPWVRALRTPTGYRIRYERRAEFAIDRGARTIACAPIDCPAPMLRHFFLDQVLPLALSLEAVVLHASSIAVDGGFAAFIGPG